MVLFTTSMVGIFLPFSQGMDLVLALGGCLIFSGASSRLAPRTGSRARKAR